MSEIRLPLSSRRRQDQTFVRLIERVRVHDQHPMSIEGPTFKCGAVVDVARLRPADHFPRVPLLMEWAGIAEAGWGKQRASSHLYVLWKYESGRFVELMRVVAIGNEWLTPIREAALREIAETDVSSAENGAQACARVKVVIASELRYLDCEAQAHFVARLYEEVTGRFTHLD